MDGESVAPQQETKTFNTGLGFTSTKLPVALEAFLSTFSVLSSAIFFFTEKQNVYCRSCALQSFIWFYVCFLASFPFYLTCIAFGGVAEMIMIIYVVVYWIFKVIMIIMAVVGARSENFIAIPPFTHLINKYASLNQ